MKKSLVLVTGIVSTLFSGFISPAYALTITNGPVLAFSTNAPLACKLDLATDEDSRVSVVVSDGQVSWTRNFYDYGKTHSLVLAGFKADRTNQITVIVHDKFRHQSEAESPLAFTTAPLPAN